MVFAVGGCACFDVFDWLLVNAFDGDGVRDLRNTAQKRAQRPGLTGTCVAPNAPKIQTDSKKIFWRAFLGPPNFLNEKNGPMKIKYFFYF